MASLKRKLQEMTSLKRKLQEIFKCPVCLAVPREGPVIQCYEGHAMCQGCAEKTEDNRCPVCRARINASKRIRSLLVEQAIEAADFEHNCRYGQFCQSEK